MNIGLVVMHDCDSATVEASRVSLEGSVMRKEEERIALFFPRRNIETWIHFLINVDEVDESKAYPKLARESECHEAVDRLAEKPEYRLSSRVPHSLRVACAEIRRLFPEKRCLDSGE